MLILPKPGEHLTALDLATTFQCSTQGGMRRSHRTGTLVLVSTRFGNPYQDRWVGNTLHYTGMGQRGDQRIDWAQNKTLNNHQTLGVSVHLFDRFEKGIYFYQGEVYLSDQPYRETQTDADGIERRVWIFPLQLKSGTPVTNPLKSNIPRSFNQPKPTLDPETPTYEIHHKRLEKLIRAGESRDVEFKKCATYNAETGARDKTLAWVVARAVASFLNTEGGTLIIGVNDTGQVTGLSGDYKVLTKNNRDPKDSFETEVRNTLTSFLGQKGHEYQFHFETVDGKDICGIDVPQKSKKPVWICKPKSGEEEFFVRTGNKTQRYKPSDATEYIKQHWP